VSIGIGRKPRADRRPGSGLALAFGLMVLLALAVCAQTAAGQSASVPFAVGEELVYRASSSRFGKLGTGTMTVTGPEEVQGRRAYVLGFDFRGRIGPAVVRDRTRSWLDPRAMASLRYQKTERTPLGSRNEDVRMDLSGREWTAADGERGGLASAAPLDELSFLFLVRTLPLEDGATYDLNRHFDAQRNPVRFRVLGRQTVVVPAGEFRVVTVEMRVRDPERYKDGREAVIRLYVTDDDRRIPVRIDSSMPWVGSVTMALQAVNATAGRVAAN
jgi:hypothetical protein